MFDWSEDKEAENIKNHQVDFSTAQLAFLDEKRLIVHDEKHSEEEERYFCIGKVGNDILTVRFTYRKGRIRIFGAGYWRKQRKYYAKENGQ